MIRAVLALAALPGCLYLEAGAGVYGGEVAGDPRAAAGVTITGGVYLDLGDGRGDLGGGGTAIVAPGAGSFTSTGSHAAVHVGVTGDVANEARGALRVTAGISALPGDDDGSPHPAWSAHLGLLRAREVRRGGPFYQDQHVGWSYGLVVETVQADDAWFVGPSLRASAGANVYAIARALFR